MVYSIPLLSVSFLLVVAAIARADVTIDASNLPPSDAPDLHNSCKGLGPGNASPDAPFWMENIAKLGSSPYHPTPDTYKVFRNVKDYGAVGDGVTDDSDAINNAMADGIRCGQGCDSSTVSPAVVYFPKGTYLLSRPLVAWYYSQIVGDARDPPTLLAAPNFQGMAVIDADPYTADGQWYINQNNFFRSVRNIVIDLRQMPPSASATGLHWQVSQATSLINVRVEMSTEPGNNHQGIFMENGSGGLMSDLVFRGGKFGIWVGNQQFTVRNITISDSQTAVFAIWNWAWTFQGLKINNCTVGFAITTGGTTAETQGVGAEAIIDADIQNTPIFVQTSRPSNGTLAGSVLLDNIKLRNVPVAVGSADGQVVLSGTNSEEDEVCIDQWAQGNVYSGKNPQGKYVQSSLRAPHKAHSLLENGWIVGRSRPQYEDYSVDQFASVKAHGGAKGDGETDDTEAIKRFIEKYHKCKILYFDAGTYIVTDTITFPAGSRVLGEIWTTIMGAGHKFASADHPHVVVRVGENSGDCGVTEISDMVFSTRGPAPGAIVVEWNAADPEGMKGVVGSWDTHIRLGSFAGSNLGQDKCIKFKDSGDGCFAAYLALHLTKHSTAYLEGLWAWNSDHELDQPPFNQTTIYSGRGILSQSEGPVWMIGTGSEHHVMYQYSLVGAKNHYMGLIQTETPYFQPVPPAPCPFAIDKSLHDPEFNGETSSWALYVKHSHDILVYGAGLYSFFQNYSQECIANSTCQNQLLDIDHESSISIYQLSTVGTAYMLSVEECGVIHQADNRNGFQATVTAWTRDNAIEADVVLRNRREHRQVRRLSADDFAQ